MSTEIEEVENSYATKDLYFASFLFLKGIQIKKLEKTGRSSLGQFTSNQRFNPVYFVFEGRERCEELEDVFWNGVGGELVGNIKDYISVLRDLKSRAFSVSRRVNRAEEEFERGR